jgi:type VI protein secretion system component VasK
VANRIVINVEPGNAPAARAPKSGRRWLRILGILALVVVALIVVVAIAGYFGWRRFQASPEYSLTLLVDAAQRNDQEQLAKLIDDDEIAKNIIASVSQKAVERYGGAMNASTQQQIDKLMPTLLPTVKQTIHNEVANQLKTFAASSEPKPFIVLLATVPSLVKINTEGDTARATASLSDRKIDLTMHRDADRWKVVAVNDDALVQRVVDGVMKDLPPAGGFDANSPLFKNLGRPRKRNR